MKTSVMLGLQILGIVLSAVLAGLRILLLLRQEFKTRLDILGTVSMCIGVAMAIAAFSVWAEQGVQILKWASKGQNELQIRALLNTPHIFKVIFAADLLHVGSLWFPKVAFLAGYTSAYRAFPPRLRLLFRVTIVVTTLTFLGSLSILAFYCFPVSRNWDLQPKPGKKLCLAVVQWPPIFVTCVLNIISDLFILAVPIIALLQLPTTEAQTQRYGVMAIIGLGFISIGMTFYRMLAAKLGGYTEGRPLPLAERNWYIFGTMVMVVSSLIAFSIPSLRVLVRKRRLEKSKSSSVDAYINLEMSRTDGWSQKAAMERGE
ncbi:hypothetical protein BDD12DRAFT_815932 [Trichophaea hybrida]|nr:hypothetical protein BDD12DRAFT_815932 [Trichophaea hybrida]